MISHNIFLIGFMGTGKSTVAEYLHSFYHMQSIEMDEVIAQREGMSIQDIFRVHGEDYFRKLETALLKETKSADHTVISCGGGAAMREQNVKEMKKNGKVVLLTAEAETIFSRVREDGGRPLLNGNKNVEFIQQLMEERRTAYEAAADIVIDTDGKSVQEIGEEIMHELRRKTVTVRRVVLGEGRPKICASITGRSKEEILEEAGLFRNLPVDLAEWRADWFEQIEQREKVREVLRELREVLAEIPLLFTYRTKQQGGEQELALEEYLSLNEFAAASGYADLIDVEFLTCSEAVSDIVKSIHHYNVPLIMSHHDFEKTPSKDEMIERLCRMQELGADILKIAVMPNSRKDVLTLLETTEEMDTKYAERPIVTMSMSGTGVISRLCGEVFGSAMTFGSVKKASAPGQVEVSELDRILTLMHTS